MKNNRCCAWLGALLSAPLSASLSAPGRPWGRVPMWCATGLLGWAGSAWAVLPDGDWLTIVGDAANPAMTSVAVSPTPVSRNGLQRVMKVRINRAGPRSSAEGVQHRSLEALALFDCAQRSARYVSKTYFADPLWTGEPVRTVTYSKNDLKPFHFADVQPDPAPLLLRAACGTQAVQSR